MTDGSSIRFTQASKAVLLMSRQAMVECRGSVQLFRLNNSDVVKASQWQVQRVSTAPEGTCLLGNLSPSSSRSTTAFDPRTTLRRRPSAICCGFAYAAWLAHAQSRTCQKFLAMLLLWWCCARCMVMLCNLRYVCRTSFHLIYNSD